VSAVAHARLLRGSVLATGAYVPGVSVAEVKARFGRDDMVRLNWNENLLGPLPGVLAEVAAALDSVWAYPEDAYEAFRESVARWTGADPAAVIPGHGIQALTLALVTAFVDPGEAVIVPRPTYGLYAQACATAGAEVIRVDGRAGSPALDLEAIAAAATAHRAKLVWICDPNNPTGLSLAAADWTAFLDALPAGAIAVADEAYGDYIDPIRRIDRLADVRAGRSVIVMRTFSKIFGLAGLRLGYLLVHESLAPHLHSVQEPFNVNRAALAAGIASLRRTELLPARREQAGRARDRLNAPLHRRGLRSLPSDANFVLIDVQTDDVRVADELARDGILVRPGTELSLPGHIRVTTGDEELMDVVGERIAAAVAS
jgi:histidinol-phosphate aminotransferase